MNTAKKTVWNLGSGQDRRFRAGHPWVYSNELSISPKGIESGAEVELRDAGGAFLARGYGNPASLIAFRVLSRDPSETEPGSSEGIARRLATAVQLRLALGYGDVSFRLCHGEADGIPGLIIDRYLCASKPGAASGQVFVIQAQTAGAERLKGRVLEALQALGDALRAPESQGFIAGLDWPEWRNSAHVFRNDSSSRKLEGLPESANEVQGGLSFPLTPESAKSVKIKVRGPLASNGSSICVFEVDLATGQKTGFFLDQTANIALAAQLFRPLVNQLKSEEGTPLKTIRILDLCCYVGQWGAQLARVLAAPGRKIEVTLVDASAPALALARRNVEAQGANCVAVQADVLRDLENPASELAAGHYDIVISDPPALIKGRKAVAPGTHAYLQLNTQALKRVKTGGAFVSCSCSALLEEEVFLRTLSKASKRAACSVRWVGRGAQSPDHPMLAEFPEGRYLKAWFGVVNR